MTRNPMRSRLLFLELSGDFGETSLQPDLFRFDRAIGSDTRRWRKRRYSDDAVTSSSKRLACYQMNRRFDPSIIESFSEIPACRAREVLFLLIEVDPISGKECEQCPKAYPKEYREVLEKLYLAEDHGDITIKFLEETNQSIKANPAKALSHICGTPPSGSPK